MRVFSGSLGVMALAVLLGSAGLSAADPTTEPAPAPAPVPTTGTISGKVVDANGNGVPNADVKLFVVPAKKNAKAAPATQPAPAAAKKSSAAVQETTTDKDGKYAFKDVSAGTFRINVKTSDKPALKGLAKKVAVVAGQDTAVDDIKVLAKAAKAPKAPAPPAAN